MPDHPFENPYPFPDKINIREQIALEIKTQARIIPPEHLVDSKAYIDALVKGIYQEERAIWQESEDKAIASWQKFQEEEHGFSNLPESLRQKIHSQVWEDSHSGGYGEMEGRYLDLVPLVLEAFELGKNSK